MPSPCLPLRRSVLSFAALALLASLPTAWAQAQETASAASQPTGGGATRPNILFIFTDDHGTQAMSCYGSKINQTPNMDRLAREGMLFKHCLVTNAICGPSRAVIQTGKYGHLNGFLRNGDVFDGEQTTFPKLLQRAGYQTAVIGKWHLESTPRGFDHFQVLIGQGPYYNPVTLIPGADGKPARQPLTGYTTDLITDLSLDWLKRRDPKRPFMLMCQHKAPHRNWEPAPRHLQKYEDTTLPEPATLFDDYAGRASPAREQQMTIARHLEAHDLKLDAGPGNLTPEQQQAWDAAYGPANKAFRDAKLKGDDLVRWKYQRYAKDYLRCVDAVDESIGRVLAYLDEAGLAKDTVVVYSSDQGWYLGEHGWYDKRWMYEESLRTPLLVRWPGSVKPGSVNSDMVSNLDFAQTFLDLAGVAQPADMQGASLVPLLKGSTPEAWRKSFYYHYYEFPGVHAVARHYGVRTSKHKLIHYYQKKEWELFDLEKDPDELRSVHADPAYAAVRAELEAELVKLRKQHAVPEVDPEQKPAPKPAPNPNKPGKAAKKQVG